MVLVIRELNQFLTGVKMIICKRLNKPIGISTETVSSTKLSEESGLKEPQQRSWRRCMNSSSSERERVEFIVERDGSARALEWARRTLKVYRMAARDMCRRDYREEYIRSSLELRRFIRDEKKIPL